VARFADLHEALCHLNQWKQRRNEVCYCRFGDDSDVYLRRSGGEIVCAFCALEPDHGDVPLDDPGLAEEHLLEHADAGHKVPGDAFHRLRGENEQRPAPSNRA
jgi:hypothetical protein